MFGQMIGNNATLSARNHNSFQACSQACAQVSTSTQIIICTNSKQHKNRNTSDLKSKSSPLHSPLGSFLLDSHNTTKAKSSPIQATYEPQLKLHNSTEYNITGSHVASLSANESEHQQDPVRESQHHSAHLTPLSRTRASHFTPSTSSLPSRFLPSQKWETSKTPDLSLRTQSRPIT
jgi:hypothetical protein